MIGSKDLQIVKFNADRKQRGNEVLSLLLVPDFSSIPSLCSRYTKCVPVDALVVILTSCYIPSSDPKRAKGPFQGLNSFQIDASKRVGPSDVFLSPAFEEVDDIQILC